MKTLQQGFTMIELMISMVLGLGLIAGVCSIFINFQNTSTVQMDLSYMLEDGRYVLEAMSKELRRTGYLRNEIGVTRRTAAVNNAGLLRNENNLALTTTAEYCDSRIDATCPVFLQDPSIGTGTGTSCYAAGCTGVLGSTGTNVSGTPSVTYYGINFLNPVVSSAGTFMEAIRGITGDSTKTDITASDSFAIRYQLYDSSDLMAPSNGTGTQISYSPCTQNIHLTVKTATTGNSDGNGLLNEDPAAPVAAIPTSTLGGQVNVVTIYFYVANDSNNIPTLYCRAKRENQFAGNSGATANNGITTTIYNTMNPDVSTTPTAQPLVSNIYRLVVRYGIELDPNNTPSDKTDDTFYYTDASNVSDWTSVISTKVYVVLRSDDNNIAKNSPTYSIEGVACGSGSTNTTGPCPTDKRFYRVFSTTVAFRNNAGL